VVVELLSGEAKYTAALGAAGERNPTHRHGGEDLTAFACA
jgi:hypothetical protein